MISLKIMDICEDCLYFAPEANTTVDYGALGPLGVKTTVTCKNEEICRRTEREILRKAELK